MENKIDNLKKLIDNESKIKEAYTYGAEQGMRALTDSLHDSELTAEFMVFLMREQAIKRRQTAVIAFIVGVIVTLLVVANI